MTRTCCKCGKHMIKGYVIDGGQNYYCNKKCLLKDYTRKERIDLYDNGNSETYRTDRIFETRTEAIGYRIDKPRYRIIDIDYHINDYIIYMIEKENKLHKAQIYYNMKGEPYIKTKAGRRYIKNTFRL